MVRLFEQGTKAFSKLTERSGTNDQGPYSLSSEVSEAAKSLGEVARQMAESSKFVAAQGELFKSYADLWSSSIRRFLGEEVKPVAEPEPGDNRFKTPTGPTVSSSTSGSRPISSLRAGQRTSRATPTALTRGRARRRCST